MFEKIVLRKSEKGPALSAGELAEALLFYQNVHIILDFPSLNLLVEQIGMPRLLALLSKPNVSAVYCEEMLATRTDRIDGKENHSFVAFTFTGSQEVGQLSRRKRIEYILSKKGYERRIARKLAERFREIVPYRNFSDDYFVPGGIVRAASEDILDCKFIHEAVRNVLVHTVGVSQPLGNYRFEIIPNQMGFQVATDIDFLTINEARKRIDPHLGDIGAAHVASEILLARADTALAAHYGGEFYTSEVSSQIVRIRYSELLRRAGIDAEERCQLKEIILATSPSIKEVIDSGTRTFEEFLSLLDKAEQFRGWIRGIHPDEKLVKEYLKAVTTESWISKLPSKTVRYVLGAVVGLAAQPVAGLILSAADSLLLEKILGGWRPSHFVERRLKPFLKANDDED